MRFQAGLRGTARSALKVRRTICSWSRLACGPGVAWWGSLARFAVSQGDPNQERKRGQRLRRRRSLLPCVTFRFAGTNRDAFGERQLHRQKAQNAQVSIQRISLFAECWPNPGNELSALLVPGRFCEAANQEQSVRKSGRPTDRSSALPRRS